MKHSLPGIVGLALLVMAGCSSKSAVSSGEGEAGAGAGAGAGMGSGIGSGSVYAGLGDVFFDFDSSALSAESQDQLRQNAAWIRQNAGKTVTIEGHCDERGTDEYNIALGDRRATSAKEYLVTLGVGGNRLKTVSFGEERPFDPGHNEDSWAKNRRAHFLAQ